MRMSRRHRGLRRSSLRRRRSLSGHVMKTLEVDTVRRRAAQKEGSEIVERHVLDTHLNRSRDLHGSLARTSATKSGQSSAAIETLTPRLLLPLICSSPPSPSQCFLNLSLRRFSSPRASIPDLIYANKLYFIPLCFYLISIFHLYFQGY